MLAHLCLCFSEVGKGLFNLILGVDKARVIVTCENFVVELLFLVDDRSGRVDSLLVAATDNCEEKSSYHNH